MIISITILPNTAFSAILKESAGLLITAMGGVTMTQVTVYKPMVAFYGFAVIGAVLSFAAGFYLSVLFRPITGLDILSFLGVFLGIPVLVAFLSFYVGRFYKKNIVEYSPPEWEFKPVQLTIEDAKKLPREYNRKYSRLVANSNFWYFFTPILLILLISTFPLYAFYENVSISEYVPILNAVSLTLMFLISLFGAFKSISNSASADFNLPLIREAVKLAEIQSKVAGVCNARVVLDKAVEGELAIYDNPRVIIRIEGLVNEAYIESWSEDLRAVTRVLGRLYEKDENPQVVWWWFSTDRNFRKFIHPDEEGYYVKHPINTKIRNPGVKDIALVTQNAVALIIKEYLKTRGETTELLDILNNLQVENH
ncbi:MAG: hypothetical protein ACFFDV_03475 [Candidatus Thorarchaeota archaeon]